MRAHVMEAPRAQRVRQRQRVARALDVDLHFLRGVGGEVVDRAEMEDMVDLAVQGFDRLGVDAAQRRGEVAWHRNGAGGVDAPEIAQGFRRSGEGLRIRKWTSAPGRDSNFWITTLADEAAAAGDEVDHGSVSAFLAG